MIAAIAWGEADVRDAMEGFDPAPIDFGAPCVQGVRGQVVVFAYWESNWRERRNSVYRRGRLVADFEDPIEAIAYATDLARKEQV